jgi:hypothetical protein
MIINQFKVFKNLLVSLLVVTNFALSIQSSRLPQCCDALIYEKDAKALFNDGIFYELHNYLYPLFLKILFAIELNTRFEVALIQTLVLLASGYIFGKSVKKTFPGRKNIATHLIILIFLLPFSYGFSGYFLSEALALPLIFLYLSELLKIINKLPKPKNIILLFSFSVLIWMTRPAFIWLPLFTLGILLIDKNIKFREKAMQLSGVIIILFIVVLPQYLISASSKSLNRSNPLFDGVLHLNLAKAQNLWADNYYRYATNLSGCGDSLMFNFSPKNLTGEEALNNIYTYTTSEKLITSILHLVSGWDALPGISYVNNISYFPWIVVSIFSGLFISAPLILSIKILKNQFKNEFFQKNLAKILLPLFLITQIFLINTAVEFRFNIMGWTVSLLILFMLLEDKSIRLKQLFILSFILSTIILLLGSYTLQTSEIWKNCI